MRTAHAFQVLIVVVAAIVPWKHGCSLAKEFNGECLCHRSCQQGHYQPGNIYQSGTEEHASNFSTANMTCAAKLNSTIHSFDASPKIIKDFIEYPGKDFCISSITKFNSNASRLDDDRMTAFVEDQIKNFGPSCCSSPAKSRCDIEVEFVSAMCTDEEMYDSNALIDEELTCAQGTHTLLQYLTPREEADLRAALGLGKYLCKLRIADPEIQSLLDDLVKYAIEVFGPTCCKDKKSVCGSAVMRQTENSPENLDEPIDEGEGGDEEVNSQDQMYSAVSRYLVIFMGIAAWMLSSFTTHRDDGHTGRL